MGPKWYSRNLKTKREREREKERKKGIRQRMRYNCIVIASPSNYVRLQREIEKNGERSAAVSESSRVTVDPIFSSAPAGVPRQGGSELKLIPAMAAATEKEKRKTEREREREPPHDGRGQWI